MTRFSASIVMSIVAGTACVYLLPPPWLGPISAIAAICAGVLVLVVRITTRTAPPPHPMTGILLSQVNLPERPLANVKEGWPLATLLSLAAFLASLALSIVVRANG